MKGVSRRAVLRRLAAGGLLFNVPAWPAWACTRPSADPLAQRVAQLFSNEASATEIGRRYLALGTEPADIAMLAARVAGDRAAYQDLCGVDADGLRKRLARQQRRDFAAGRMVNVDGWMLSLTEARACAIAALVHARG